jgi:hypothetical protein
MLRWLLWWRPPCLLRACIVNLTDDPATAIKGVLWSSRGAWLTFKECSGLKAGQSPAAIDGEVVIHRDRVAFLQVLP